jgi:DNA-binding transcriptional LysR family regulator
MKLQRLEATLGKRLVERSPRAVRLTAAGSNFLVHARALMEAHDRALTSEPSARQQLSLGISDHAAGPELVPLLARLHAVSPQLALSVDIGFSRNLLEAYDGGELEAVIVRQEGGRRGGGMVDIGPPRGLPKLSSSKVMLHSKVSDAGKLAAPRMLAATFRSAVAG